MRKLLGPDLWLSVVNGPTMCVVSGAQNHIEQLEKQLRDERVDCQRLHTSHAFHSGLMDGAIEPFVEAVRGVELNSPRIPYISNVSGSWIEESQVKDPLYWGRQIRETVRFASGVTELAKKEDRIYLEVGPGYTLGALVRQQASGKVGQVVLSSLRHAQGQGSDVASVLSALGRLWLSGVRVDWSCFYGAERRCRVALPTYPFQRERYWVDSDSSRDGRTARTAKRDRRTGRLPHVEDWFYAPVWTRSTLPMPVGGPDLESGDAAWLVFMDDCGLGDRIVERLKGAGHRLVTVSAADRFSRVAKGRYTINPQSRDDYIALIK